VINVCFGSKADILQRNRHVRFTPKADLKTHFLSFDFVYNSVVVTACVITMWRLFSNWFARLALVLTAIVAPETFLNAAQPCCGQTSVDGSLAGQLLIASPAIRDPHFDHAVILVVRHNQDGAWGIVINMPTGERLLTNVLEMLGEKGTNVTAKVQLFAGGPVQPELGFVIHSSDYRGSGTIDVNRDMLVTSNSRILRDIGDNQGPKKSLIAFGYAGWAAHQLDDELRRRVWFTTPADVNLVFDETREKLWDSAYAHRAQDL
jgi:putative transcriptional regulator